jgi:hypothetical protein
MTLHTVLENYIITEAASAWADLIVKDRERGGNGRLRDTALSLIQGRTMIALHCDFHDGDRTLTSWFRLPEPLPPDRESVCEFLMDLHEWLEGGPTAPRSYVRDPRVTLH